MKLRRTLAAFTLIELLTVIAIIGILAAVTAPVLNNFRKGDAMLAATRTMLDGVARARQLAISQHTTVYMVFVPPNFWVNSAPLYPNNGSAYASLSPSDLVNATNALEKQLTGFTFVSLRSIGDQPGQNTVRYLSEWQSLPEKSFVASWKFGLAPNTFFNVIDSASGQTFPVFGFNLTNNIPFPSQYSTNSIGFMLPYVAFDYQGRLVAGNGTLLGHDEFIPLAHGSVAPAMDGNKHPIFSAPSIQEQTPGNSTSTAYNLIHIDALTGRARLEHQQVK